MSGDFSKKRRQILRGLGLGLAAYISPAVLGLNMARASGHSSISDFSRPSGPSRPSAPSRPNVAPAPPEIVLLSGAEIDAALTQAGYGILQKKSLRHAQLYRLSLPAGEGLDGASRALAAEFPEARIDENALYRPEEFICADGSCLAHEAVMWPQNFSDIRVKIGMIDTGVNAEHAALAGQALRVEQADLGTRSSAGRQHGTAVASLLIGRRDSRTPGLLPNAELIAIEAFHQAAGTEAADAFSLAEALDRLVILGVRVINLSFSGPENLILHEMILRTAEAGIALVAAAGNGGAGAPAAYPAAWPEVIAVTAVDTQHRPYRQANRGDYINFAAPGVNLWAAASISGGRLKSGTSYAAPFVTAALAARLALQPQLPVAAHVENLRRCAQDLGAEGEDPVFGSGFVSMEEQCFE